MKRISLAGASGWCPARKGGQDKKDPKGAGPPRIVAACCERTAQRSSGEAIARNPVFAVGRPIRADPLPSVVGTHDRYGHPMIRSLRERSRRRKSPHFSPTAYSS